MVKYICPVKSRTQALLFQNRNLLSESKGKREAVSDIHNEMSNLKEWRERERKKNHFIKNYYPNENYMYCVCPYIFLIEEKKRVDCVFFLFWKEIGCR